MNPAPAANVDCDSMIAIQAEPFGVFKRSEAVARALSELGGGWRLVARFLQAIPKPLRDAGYDFFARHRFQLFGRSETCRVPAEAERALFLE